MIVTAVAVVVFLYYKNGIVHRRNRHLQIMALCLSLFNAALFIFYAVRLITLGQKSESIISLLVGGFNASIAVLLVIDGMLTELYSRHLNSKRVTSSRTTSVNSLGNIHVPDAPQAPLPVHLYQPRLSLTPNERTSIHSGTSAPTGDDTDTAQQDDDAMELEELPKYQRRRPAQHATIVDLSNLDGVDATLRSAISVSSLDVTNPDGNGLAQGRDSRLELEGDLATIEAPEYSPSLVEPTSETTARPASPAPTSGLSSSQLATSLDSGESVILTMPLSETSPAQPATAPTDTPHITVTSAPPDYTP
ncbi:hypothetical protein EC968_000579 [Mortierella alpina]|nr:hypothetical protein EC968_000579 [Mortierella alpina]